MSLFSFPTLHIIFAVFCFVFIHGFLIPTILSTFHVLCTALHPIQLSHFPPFSYLFSTLHYLCQKKTVEYPTVYEPEPFCNVPYAFTCDYINYGLYAHLA